MSHPIPQRPSQNISSDLCVVYGKDYLVIVDAYSGYFEIALLDDTTSETIIKHCKSIFARHGIPDEFFTDNGSNLVSRNFQAFAKAWEFKLVTSSPRFPQSNGLVEKAVQTVKKILKRSFSTGEDPYLGLLAYRSTPREADIASPAKLLMGRNLRTRLPTATSQLLPVDAVKVQQQIQTRRDTAKAFFDGKSRALKPLNPGDNVMITSPDKQGSPGIVEQQTSDPISYLVRTRNNTLRRNRRHLRQVPRGSIQENDLEQEIEDVDSDATISNERLESRENELLINTTPDTPQLVTTRSGRLVRPPDRYGH
ncbi:uncharacterized protein K02A2.6-like [Lineus longissimus]|uniref:uncharacterized protein K02A2.6-like n=1 Tax=Lineus longissimus TaxID=88925 RepID=UPI00315D85EC